jgi:regulator-associated protein of mTOR
MRTASGQLLPNPLAAHAPVDMASTVAATSAAASAPRETRPSQDTTSSRPSSSSAAAHLDVQSPASTVAVRPNLSAANSHRPSLARAKSDFGPRQPAQQLSEAADDVSVDGHFRIRHGWDDQLNSEEYSNMLTSVRCVEHARASRN